MNIQSEVVMSLVFLFSCCFSQNKKAGAVVVDGKSDLSVSGNTTFLANMADSDGGDDKKKTNVPIFLCCPVV